eukprot:SM000010S04325  [mRNA]  locus=s10:927046:928509:- [translate_table: standard]
MLNKQVKRLQHEVESHRRQLLRMAGEELGGLPVSDLDELESALEGSVRRIRQRKHDLMAAEILRLRQALDVQRGGASSPPFPPASPLGGGGSGGGGNRHGNSGAAAAMAPLGEVARLNVTLPGAQRLPQLVTLQSPSSATSVERDRASAAAPPGLEGYLQLQPPPPPPASLPTQHAAPSAAAAQMLFR